MAKHFEFKDWEQAFKLFYELYATDSSYNLVISEHWASSGYWIEKDAKGTKHEPNLHIYRTLDEVQALEKRFRDAREERAIYDEQGKFKGYPVGMPLIT